MKGAAKLPARFEWHGTQIHPADLDGALQLSVINQLSNYPKKSVADVGFPFSIESSVLCGKQVGRLWAIVAGANREPSLDIHPSSPRACRKGLESGSGRSMRSTAHVLRHHATG